MSQKNKLKILIIEVRNAYIMTSNNVWINKIPYLTQILRAWPFFKVGYLIVESPVLLACKYAICTQK